MKTPYIVSLRENTNYKNLRFRKYYTLMMMIDEPPKVSEPNRMEGFEEWKNIVHIKISKKQYQFLKEKGISS